MPNRAILGQTDSSSRFYKQLVENSVDIKLDDELFQVEARTFDPETGEMTEFEEVGKILQGDAEWTESLWGDERLFFSHNFETNDLRDFRLQLFGDWDENIRERKRNYWDFFYEEMPRFDLFDKYWVEEDFEVTEADEDKIIDGIVTTGCPFAFMID